MPKKKPMPKIEPKKEKLGKPREQVVEEELERESERIRIERLQ